MGHGPSVGEGELAIHVAADGELFVDVGSRFVEVSFDDLERILERLAADRGRVRLLVEPGRADDDDEPSDRERDSGARSAAPVIALAEGLGMAVAVEETGPGG